MRLYLFPITRSRTLIYCKRTKPLALPAASTSTPMTSKTASDSPSSSDPTPSPPKPPLLDRLTTRANDTWISWERTPSGWRKTVTNWGNQLFARIPYTEWGLKSIPPLSKARAEEETTLSKLARNGPDSARRHSAEVDVVYPTRLFKEGDIKGLLEGIAKENKEGYKRKMFWTLVIAPFTLPFALVPVIPNLPFFYLMFRAYSFWRARNGCQHIEHLLEKDLVNAKPSRVLQRLYEVAPVQKEVISRLEEDVQGLFKGKEKEKEWRPEDEQVEGLALGILGESQGETGNLKPDEVRKDGAESLLYPKGHGKVVGLTLNMPEVEVELERAHAQVTKELEKARSTSRSTKEEAEKRQ